jgi:PKD repeat protein
MNIRLRSTALALMTALGLSALAPAVATAAGGKPFPAVALEKRLRGEEAVQALKDRLPEVAAWYGMTAAEFAKLLRQDRHAWLDRDARLHYIDDFPPPPEQADTVAGGGSLTTEMASLDQTFLLHSRPGAKRVMYLDFNGALVSNTAWNGATPVLDAKAFDLDGNASAFSDAELQRIQNIWRRVAEDYAPFDVDVTTEPPAPDALARSGSTDQEYGTTVLITNSNGVYSCSCGGVAYVGAFDDTTEYYKPALVFYNQLGSGNEKYVAEAISHEAGHNLGLSHDGYNNGTTNQGYYGGHGSGATGWAPIMGVGYYKELSQWSKGEYAYATTTQDDLQLIQNYGAPLRPDDHGNSLASASPLTVAGSSVSGGGVISTRTDADVFSFYSAGGSISLSVAPTALGANLDVAAALLDAAGTTLAASNPVDAINASLSLASAPAGMYYLVVDGIGKGDPSTGYSDYGSLGEYSISGTIPVSGGGSPPVAVATVSTTSGTAPLTVTFSGSGSYDPDGSALTHSWNFGDGTANSTAASPSHTYTAAGSYSATLTVTDASGQTGQAQVNVRVDAALAVARVQSISLTTATNKRGTKATATVKITDTTGKAVPGATVSGTWSGAVSGTASASTDSTGSLKFTSAVSKTGGTFTFTVNGVAAAGYSYDPNQNLETSDSISK